MTSAPVLPERMSLFSMIVSMTAFCIGRSWPRWRLQRILSRSAVARTEIDRILGRGKARQGKAMD
jgi:hypothetical protein